MRETIKKGKNKYDFKISNFKTECYYAPSTLLGVAQKLGKLEDLMEKYEFETVEELDNFLMSKIPMVYENGKWRKAKDE